MRPAAAIDTFVMSFSDPAVVSTELKLGSANVAA